MLCDFLGYMKNTSVQERLISVVWSIGTKGVNFDGILMKLLKDLNTDPNKCVGNSCHGACTCKNNKTDFSKKLSEATKEQVHIWCFAHVLNLVMCDTNNMSA